MRILSLAAMTTIVLLFTFSTTSFAANGRLESVVNARTKMTGQVAKVTFAYQSWCIHCIIVADELEIGADGTHEFFRSALELPILRSGVNTRSTEGASGGKFIYSNFRLCNQAETKCEIIPQNFEIQVDESNGLVTKKRKSANPVNPSQVSYSGEASEGWLAGESGKAELERIAFKDNLRIRVVRQVGLLVNTLHFTVVGSDENIESFKIDLDTVSRTGSDLPSDN